MDFLPNQARETGLGQDRGGLHAGQRTPCKASCTAGLSENNRIGLGTNARFAELFWSERRAERDGGKGRGHWGLAGRQLEGSDLVEEDEGEGS